MKRGMSSAVFGAVVSLLPMTATAQSESVCDPASRRGTWILDVSRERSGAGPDGLVHVQLIVAQLPSDEVIDTLSVGHVEISDGMSSTFLVGEGRPKFSCGDVDGDGLAGLTLVTFDARDVRSGARVPVTIIPVAGEIDHFGTGGVFVAVGDVTGVARYSWHFVLRRPRR